LGPGESDRDAESNIVYRYSKEPPPYIPPQKKTEFTWVWVIIICAGIWILSLLSPGQNQPFFWGVAAFSLSIFVLFHTYITGNVRTTFRAGCYIWLLFFAGIGMMFSGIGEMFK